MERNGSQFIESSKADSSSNLDLEDIRKRYNKNSLKNVLYDDVDIEKYMSLMEAELSKMGQTLKSTAFIENIINIVDKLIEPKKFNKAIFFHILEYANLDKEKPIRLSDFFRSFFTVYESMKLNQKRFAIERAGLSEMIETTKIKIKKFHNEIVLENGLTSNSRVKIKHEISSIDQFYEKMSKPAPDLKFVFKVGTNEVENFDINTLQKKTIKIDSLQQLDQPIRVFLQEDGNQIFIDKINIRDILDTPFNLKFEHNKINFELTFIWINSKVTYYNKQLAALEARVNEDIDNINILNNCLVHIEDTFRKYISPENKQVTFDVNGNKGLEITQKIEDYVLNLVGKEVLVMDKFVYFLNKVMIPFLILLFFNRCDLVTLTAVMLLLGVEFRFVGKQHLLKLLFLMTGSLLFDLVWIFYYITKWGKVFYQDGTSTGESLREFCVIMSLCLSIVKLILIFCLWRFYLESKLLLANRQLLGVNKGSSNDNSINIDVSKGVNARKSNMRVSMRPQLKSSLLGSTGTVSLRTFEQDILKK